LYDQAARHGKVGFLPVMPHEPNAPFAEAEQAELESVVEALARWPRLSHLLRYMGEKLSRGEVEELNEYNIATEVLGRSKTVFNAAEDAIARVETHRLRKRLAEFYKSEGRNHLIQVTLPSGSYVPVFTRKAEGAPSQASTDRSEAAGPDRHSQEGTPRIWVTRGWKYVVLAAAIVLTTVGAYLYFQKAAPSSHENASSGPVPVGVSATRQQDAPSSPIRILAGYSGPPRTDSVGRVWNPDQYFSAGGSWQRTPGFIARTSDPFIFEHSRTGDFSYSIPLKPGSYELHLFFSTPVRSSEAISTFNMMINEKWVLQAFDINMDALGEDIADERVFRDVSPEKDGFLRINLSGATGPATLNAIEILPSAPHAQFPVRLIMQTTPLTDRKGLFWRPDNYFMHGRLSSQTHPLLDSPDQDLFSGERFGHFTYAIPVDTRGTYTLVLHFAEFYFSAPASGMNGRIFKVMCNGQTLLDNFDIFKEAGKFHEVTKTFRHLKPSAQGKLNLTFEPIVNNATVSGIEVLDEAQ
jgi:Malectin domain